MESILNSYLLSPLSRTIVDYTIESAEVKQQKQRIAINLAPTSRIGPYYTRPIVPSDYRIYSSPGVIAENVTINMVIDSINLDNLKHVEEVVSQHSCRIGLEAHFYYCFGCQHRYFVGVRDLTGYIGLYFVYEPGASYEELDASGRLVFLCRQCQPVTCGCSRSKQLRTKLQLCSNCQQEKCIVHDFTIAQKKICKACTQIIAYGNCIKNLMAQLDLYAKYKEVLQYIVAHS